MSELTCLELSVALWVVHVLVQAGAGNAELPSSYLFTSRDKPAAARGLLFGRATRALGNYVALALALIVTQRTGGGGALGATIWILARIVYVPIYLLGVVYVRTASFMSAGRRPISPIKKQRSRGCENRSTRTVTIRYPSSIWPHASPTWGGLTRLALK
jgi:uncharacterized MAPEG superfamily protein